MASLKWILGTKEDSRNWREKNSVATILEGDQGPSRASASENGDRIGYILICFVILVSLLIYFVSKYLVYL